MLAMSALNFPSLQLQTSDFDEFFVYSLETIAVLWTALKRHNSNNGVLIVLNKKTPTSDMSGKFRSLRNEEGMIFGGILQMKILGFRRLT
jgi:hypothetical protein